MAELISVKQYNYLRGLEREGKIKLSKEVEQISTVEADRLIKQANGFKETTTQNEWKQMVSQLTRIADVLETRLK